MLIQIFFAIGSNIQQPLKKATATAQIIPHRELSPSCVSLIHSAAHHRSQQHCSSPPCPMFPPTRSRALRPCSKPAPLPHGQCVPLSLPPHGPKHGLGTRAVTVTPPLSRRRRCHSLRPEDVGAGSAVGKSGAAPAPRSSSSGIHGPVERSAGGDGVRRARRELPALPSGAPLSSCAPNARLRSAEFIHPSFSFPTL